jgi:hypothetical protein
MRIEFLDNIDYKTDVILISGLDSVDYSGRQILSIDSNNEIRFYEIKYEYHCSPFKSAVLTDNILLVGFEEYFYMFDTVKNKNLLSLKLFGYFGHFYQNDNLIYVADATGIHCINIGGSVQWRNDELGLDGVEIKEFDTKNIYGTGEWDPPGGWIDFILDKQTGEKIKNNR